MKKVIIIDDIEWTKRFKDICSSMGIVAFPSDTETEVLRSLFYLDSVASKEEATALLEAFIGDDDVLFIINYEALETMLEVEEISFYEEIFKWIPVILVFESTERVFFEHIRESTFEKINRMFISKCSNEEDLSIKGLIVDFINGEW